MKVLLENLQDVERRLTEALADLRAQQALTGAVTGAEDAFRSLLSNSLRAFTMLEGRYNATKAALDERRRALGL
ncbi:hypothetical protein [Undibacter mobilis]|uniref:Uncharacterized protein n=1 Tax=Undibacter mobilis TaxID=2292256 RepID=A0A371BC94_9BRAD|nr:hypothetical protein [Undibacter mobilis]RDV05225.1 hypothetical protein DXH78_11990 [Undibacter mobilis]